MFVLIWQYQKQNRLHLHLQQLDLGKRMASILLADDDIELSSMLVDYLSEEGFSVDVAYDGDMALSKVLANEYDLLILDVMMPKRNGFDVLRELRVRSLLPVLMLTARGDDVDSIVGLELGADDYMGKPFVVEELMARLRAGRQAAGLVRVEFWLTPAQVAKVRQFVAKLTASSGDGSKK